MARPTPLSGYPEYLPAERIVEQRVLDALRGTFELHGFGSIETRSVEPLSVLASKGEVDKEIYLLRRLHADPTDEDNADSLALHFDLTVPFARYILENAGKLQFPFRRYQIQRAWRGERPQEGRYREFTQADIDVIDAGSLPPHYEVELPLVIGEALRGLESVGLPRATIHVNNRKLASGFYRGLGIADDTLLAVLRSVDKLDKIGPPGVRSALTDGVGLSPAQADGCLALAGISSPDDSFADRVRDLGVSDPLLDEGIAELSAVMRATAAFMPGLLVADLRIARGLDYYTGTVYETFLAGQEDLGSICSGGRYDALASDGATTYPGVGLSVGLSRLLGRVFGRGMVTASRSVPTCVLVALPDEASRPGSMRIAAQLRERGIPTEVAPAPAKFGKQIRFADRRGIPWVWFPGTEQNGGAGEVKDIRSGLQAPADSSTWTPPAEDVHPFLDASPGEQAG